MDRYSRVKALEMSVNGIQFGKLNLADTRQLQEFSFDAKDWIRFANVPLIIEFKILDVYKETRTKKQR